MRKELEKLQQVAEQLNATTDLVNKALRFVQDRLEASQVGIEFWLSYALDGWQLGYDKRQLAVRRPGAPVVPLLSSERSIRAWALPLLEELVMELTKEAAELADEMEKALEKI